MCLSYVVLVLFMFPCLVPFSFFFQLSFLNSCVVLVWVCLCFPMFVLCMYYFCVSGVSFCFIFRFSYVVPHVCYSLFLVLRGLLVKLVHCTYLIHTRFLCHMSVTPTISNEIIEIPAYFYRSQCLIRHTPVFH